MFATALAETNRDLPPNLSFSHPMPMPMPMANSNRYAYPTEAAFIREQLSYEEEEHRRVQARIASVQSVLRSAEQRLLEAQEAVDYASQMLEQLKERGDAVMLNIATARGLLHPVRRLPVEILAMIFREWAAEVVLPGKEEDEDRDIMRWRSHIPFIASCVCRKWRTVALDSPYLWTYLYVNMYRVGDPELWMNYTECVIERSQASPLVLYICLPNARTETLYNNVLLQLLDTVERWRGLYLTFSTKSTLLFEFFTRGASYPILQTLLLRHQDFSQFLRPSIVTLRAPQLRSLEAIDVAIAWKQCSTFPFLEKLKIQNVDNSLELEYFVPEVVAPGLKVLDIEASRLHVFPSSNLRFKVLQSLKYCGPDTRQDFHLPELCNLELHCTSFSNPPEALLHSMGLNPTKLESLVVCDPQMPIKARFAEALLPFKQLKTLTFGNCSITKSFARELAAPDATSGEWITPQLQSIHIRSDRYSDGEGHDLHEIVSQREIAAQAGLLNAPSKISIRCERMA